MDNQNNKNNKNNKQGISFILLVTVITSILVVALFQFQGMTSAKEITYNKFLKMVDDGEVRKVQIQSDKIMIVTKKDKDSQPRRYSVQPREDSRTGGSRQG